MNVEEILAALQAILDGATDRELTDEEVERYEQLEGDLAKRKQRDEIEKRHAAYLTPTTTPVVGDTSSKVDDTLERAFGHYLRTGKENADIVELRAQSVGTDTAGGFTVPETMRQKLTERLVAFGGLAAEAETITTSSGELIKWPTLDDTANEGVIAAEGTAPASGGADLVFGEKDLAVFKYVAPGATNLPLRVSVELLQDAAFGIEALVTRKLGERIARVQATDWVTGVDTTEPQGITQPAADHTFAVGSTTTVTKDGLLDLLHTLDPDYRAGAVWLISDATLKEVRKLEDTTGRPLLMPNSDASMEGLPGGVLLGHRVVVDQAMPDMAANAKSWVFGQLSESYVIRRVQDVTVIVNPYARANEGQVEYTMWARAGGVIQNDNSFVIGANSAT